MRGSLRWRFVDPGSIDMVRFASMTTRLLTEQEIVYVNWIINECNAKDTLYFVLSFVVRLYEL